MAKVKKKLNKFKIMITANADKDMEKPDYSYIANGNVNLTATLEKNMDVTKCPSSG